MFLEIILYVLSFFGILFILNVVPDLINEINQDIDIDFSKTNHGNNNDTIDDSINAIPKIFKGNMETNKFFNFFFEELNKDDIECPKTFNNNDEIINRKNELNRKLKLYSACLSNLDKDNYDYHYDDDFSVNRFYRYLKYYNLINLCVLITEYRIEIIKNELKKIEQIESNYFSIMNEVILNKTK